MERLIDSVAGDQHYTRLQDINHAKAPNYLDSNNQIHHNFTPRSEAVINAVSELVKGYQFSPRGRSDRSVYSGYMGLALTRFLFYKRTKDSEHLEIARNLTDTALTKLTGHEVSFLTGDAGPLVLGTIIYHLLGDHDKLSVLRHQLLLLGLNPDPDIPCALINGWAGYLYSLLFLNKHIPGCISTHTIRKIVSKILYCGVELSLRKRKSIPLYFEWKGQNYHGALYGVCGILYMLLSSGVLEESEITNMVRPTLDHLITSRRLSVNYPTHEGSSKDLVQWCHGSVGFVVLFLKASEMIHPTYLVNAVECTSTIWRYGVLRKGYTLCHGVTGNAYAFIQMYKKTKDRKYLLRAVGFYEWCLHWPRYEANNPDRPFSLFKGHTGVMYFLTDLKDVGSAAMPGYEL